MMELVVMLIRRANIYLTFILPSTTSTLYGSFYSVFPIVIRGEYYDYSHLAQKETKA